MSGAGTHLAEAEMTVAELETLALAVVNEADGNREDWYDLACVNEFLIVKETQACGPFIAATSPARVLDLIADWRAMRTEISRLAAKDADSPTVRRCRELLANLKLKKE